MEVIYRVLTLGPGAGFGDLRLWTCKEDHDQVRELAREVAQKCLQEAQAGTFVLLTRERDERVELEWWGEAQK